MDESVVTWPTRLTRRRLVLTAGRAGLGLAVASLGLLAACAPKAAPGADSKPAAAAGAAKAPATAAGQTMTIGWWVGSFAQAVREAILPDFEKDHGVKVSIEEGISADAIAKVRTARDKPTHTVIGVDDQYIPELVTDGLIAKLTSTDVPNLAQIYPEYIVQDGYGIGAAVSWNTLFYHTEKVKAAPDSYAALWDKPNAGRGIIPSVKAGTGIQFLMAAAALATGKPIAEAQYQAEAAFPKLQELKANLHSIVDSSTTSAPLLASGEAWLVVLPSRIAGPFILKNAPIARVPVKEGGFQLLNTAALVANGPLQEQGKDFINRVLSEPGQLAITKLATTGPTNRTVKVPDNLAKLVPNGPEDTAKMVRLDWPHVIKNRAAWIDRWNKEIAG